ncbi:MAG: hypothetical protein NEA02_13705 [Thermoanaerobaculia bacterium]|nr:hypothetical protein [Thermoanaerobaculia bacterium]
MKRSSAVGLVAACLANAVIGSAAPQGTEPDRSRPFRARAEITLRSVRVVLTTRDGKPLSKPPSPNDIEVLEDGKKAEVFDVERLFSKSAAPAGATTAPAAAEATAAAKPRTVRQVVYVETTFLSTPAVKETARALDGLAPKLVANGPLEIVVADPEPRVFLAATRDVAKIRAALKTMGSSVPGRDWLASQRIEDAKKAMDVTFSGARRDEGESLDSVTSAKGAAARTRQMQERIVARNVLDRITRWASREEAEPGGLFVFVTDGFELDPSRFTEKLAADSNVASPGVIGFEGTLHAEVAGASALLGSLGFAVFPLTLGPERFLGTAEIPARSPIDVGITSTGTIIGPAVTQREEPLLQVAAATGGEVSTTADHLSGSLDRLSESYIVTFQAARPSDGKVHSLVVRSTRDDVSVRAPSSIAGGTPDSVARALVLGLLKGDAGPSALGVEAATDPIAAGKTTLRLKIQLGPAPELLRAVGDGRLRVSIAVAHGKDAPFVNHSEMPLVRSGEGTLYLYDAPLTGLFAGDRLAILAEELETGMAGGATLTLGAAKAP